MVVGGRGRAVEVEKTHFFPFLLSPSSLSKNHRNQMQAVMPWDVATSCIKSWVFGAIISVVSCSWGTTTTGGAKGVGESTTSAVVISLVGIFVADFALSFLFFQGQGDALKQLS